jgi:hypothetical protein
METIRKQRQGEETPASEIKRAKRQPQREASEKEEEEAGKKGMLKVNSGPNFRPEEKPLSREDPGSEAKKLQHGLCPQIWKQSQDLKPSLCLWELRLFTAAHSSPEQSLMVLQVGTPLTHSTVGSWVEVPHFSIGRPHLERTEDGSGDGERG